MLTVGINIGAENLEVSILRDEQLLGYSVVPAGWDANLVLEKAFDVAVQLSKIKREEIEKVGVSGPHKVNTELPAVYFSDLICSSRGVVWAFPSARTAVDIGAENNSVLSCDAAGKLLSSTKGSGCAAGTGAFLEEIASLLELKVEDLGQLSRLSKKQILMSSSCVVFAESEVISLVHQGYSKEDIIQAINDSVTSRTLSLFQVVGVKKDVVFIGGVAKNIGIVDSLSKKLGLNVLVPREPDIITAVGAALLAQ
jgi:predicted CoA-substrate-specific enzyme activase